MSNESPKPAGIHPDVREQLEKEIAQLVELDAFASQAFVARQGFYEKLILLNGATLTLLFTVIGGLSHSTVSKDVLASISGRLFLGCWLFVVSIIFSLAHNQLNIAYVIHMSGAIRRAALRGRQVMLGLALTSAGMPRPPHLDNLSHEDPDAAESMRKGSKTEAVCRWFGMTAQALTIFGYVAFVASLQTVIRALAGAP